MNKKKQNQKFKITDDSAGQRLDIFLVASLQLSRGIIQKLMKEKKVLVNNKAGKNSLILKENDEVFCEEIYPETEKVMSENKPLKIIYEDEDLAVINKDPGIISHPNNTQKQGTLVNILKHHFPKLSDVNGKERAGIVHRLDKDTEGLMVIAKTNQAHRNLSKQFKDRNVTKKYYAMVKGNVFLNEMALDFPLGRKTHKRNKIAVITSGKEKVRQALTEIKVIKRYNTKTLLDVTPKTGRTHQIRVHLAYIKHPVLHDPLYSKNKKTGGQLLQAYYLKFTHPKTKQLMKFEISISARLQE